MEIDPCSHVDLEMSFLLRLFAVCKIVLLYYCPLDVSTIMPLNLVISLILCASLKSGNETYSLAGYEL